MLKNNIKSYTILIRKSIKEYVAVCLELNVSARGGDLPEVEENIKNAIADYIDAFKNDKDIIIEPISPNELIEFIRDTKPKSINRNIKFFPVELNEVPVYV